MTSVNAQPTSTGPEQGARNGPESMMDAELKKRRNRRSRFKSVYDLGFSRPDNRFIPVSVEDLVGLLSSDTDIFGPAAAATSEVADVLTLVMDQERNAFERLTANAYRAFNPDRETMNFDGVDAEQNADDSVVTTKLYHMLEKANFERLSPSQVEAAIKAGNTHGMRVRIDMERTREMSIWVRGRSTSKQKVRTLTSPIRGEEVEIAVFNRLVLVAGMRDENTIHVRLFKSIPIRDVEALLPNVKVRMNPRDAAMMVGGGATAVWSVVTKLTILSAIAFSQLLWVLALPLAGLSWRIFSGYRRAIRDRDSHRARNLYFQSLGTNMSAVHMLAGMITDEETKEALLLYSFCAGQAVSHMAPASFEELDQRIRNYLFIRVGAEVDFDMKDAVETLDRLNLWADRDAMSVVGPEEAVRRLDEHRRERRSARYHQQLLGIGG